MVNIKDNIGSYIQEPTTIQKGDLESLQQLAERYPYCSTLSILLLEAYHQFDFVSYENFLSKSAVLAPDRERLHQVLEFQQGQVESEETVEEKADNHSVDSAVEKVDQHKEEVQIDDSETPVEQDDGTNQEEENKQEKEYDDFEKQLVASAVNSSILSEVEEDDAFDFSSFRQKKEELDLDEEEVREEIISEEVEESESSPESFIDFLKKVKHKNDQASARNKKTVHSQESIDLTHKKREEESNRKKEIVDEFINSPKQASRPSFFSPTETAKKSLEENQENVSETLAKIHELQGNYGKAIQTYEKLILKIPEKKSFFANRIEELKKK